MVVKRRRAPKKIRVNFEMDRDEYETFKQLVESTPEADVSKALRALVRGFMTRRKKETMATSIVHETGMGRLADPELPDVPGEDDQDESAEVA